MIKNLDSIKVSYSRVDMGGVVRKCGSTIEFTGKAYDAILAHYAENYLQSSGVFAVFIADNNWNYSKVWECPLDFASLKYDANVLTIGCVDNSAAAIIKANKKSKYEFSVNEIAETQLIKYEGVETLRQATFSCAGESYYVGPNEYYDAEETDMKFGGQVGSPYSGTNGTIVSWPAISFNASDFDSTKVSLHANEGGEQFFTTGESGSVSSAIANGAHFIECIATCVVNLNIDILVKNSIYTNKLVLYCGTRKIHEMSFGIGGSMPFMVHFRYSGAIRMTPGEKLFFGALVNIGRWSQGSGGCVIGTNSNQLSINETEYDENNKYLKNVTPLGLLKKLVATMTEGRDFYVNPVIDTEGSLLEQTRLVAAETLRGFTTPLIHTSFADFCNFMEVVFGYVYTLEDVGFHMDRELSLIDSADLEKLSHIRKSLLTSQTMNPVAPTIGYYKMLPVGGFIDEDVEDALDITTSFSYALPAGGSYNSYLENILYDSIHNVFVVWDATTEKYYANFTMENAIMQGSWYNENGHAKEMIGLNIATFYEETGDHLYGIIRNGKLVVCDKFHSKEWIDSDENNRACIDLTFKHRSKVFKSDIIKSLQHVNNLSYEFDESLAFSDIEVGYSKVDYDNDNNAKSEFNFTNYYKTNNDISEQTLSLICPYRADCYGVEEVIIKRNSSESTKSDNNIFIIIVNDYENDDLSVSVDRSLTISGVDTNTVFNAAIAPNRIILNNEEYIGACANMLVASNILKFTSSDGNSNAVIGGTSMHANINITKQLFKGGKISIDTDDQNFPADWEGVIEFEYAGKTYKGFLDSIDICFANMGTITYNLIEKCIE